MTIGIKQDNKDKIVHILLDKRQIIGYIYAECHIIKGGMVMEKNLMVQTKVFDLSYRIYGNLSELAEAMDISVSQVYRVKEGKRHINQKFIVGAVKAFPGYSLDELFYLTPEKPDSVVSRVE